LALKSTATGEITQSKGHYAVQGHSKVTTFGTNRELICDFLSANLVSRAVSNKVTLKKSRGQISQSWI